LIPSRSTGSAVVDFLQGSPTARGKSTPGSCLERVEFSEIDRVGWVSLSECLPNVSRLRKLTIRDVDDRVDVWKFVHSLRRNGSIQHVSARFVSTVLEDEFIGESVFTPLQRRFVVVYGKRNELLGWLLANPKLPTDEDEQQAPVGVNVTTGPYGISSLEYDRLYHEAARFALEQMGREGKIDAERLATILAELDELAAPRGSVAAANAGTACGSVDVESMERTTQSGPTGMGDDTKPPARNNERDVPRANNFVDYSRASKVPLPMTSLPTLFAVAKQCPRFTVSHILTGLMAIDNDDVGPYCVSCKRSKVKT
jgi:hypothetical protein